MIRVGFYINNNGIENLNCEKIYDFNPGMGGTPYLFFLLTYYLSEKYKKNLDVILLTTNFQKLNKVVKNVVVDDEYKAADYCKDNNIDILVIRTTENLKFYKYIEENQINIITWSHNFINDYKVIKELSKNNYVKRNVFVGKEQLEYYIDDPIYDKSTYIFNLFNSSNYSKNISEVSNKKNIVTYIGSLIPQKGFHVLARNWHKIKQAVPDAELYVVGGGNLYDRSNNIEKLIPCDKSYEKKITKALRYQNDEIGKSIHFMGVLGEDKNEIIKLTKVGISNPSGKTETFGLTALEFESSGVPVVTKKCCGYLDTVLDQKSGYLFNTENEMVKYIIKLLKDDSVNLDMSLDGIRFVEEKFNINDTCSKWIELFENVNMNKKHENEDISSNKKFKCKNVKLLIRKLRIKLGVNISYRQIKLLCLNTTKRIIRGYKRD